MPESENGQQPSTPSFAEWIERYFRYGSGSTPIIMHPRRYDWLRQQQRQFWNAENGRISDHMPDPAIDLPQEYPQTATEAMVTPSVDVAQGLYRLEADRTALMEFVDALPRRDGPEPQWVTARIVSQDNIFDPEDEYWPQGCAAICPKPKTREGISAFYERFPELRGVA